MADEKPNLRKVRIGPFRMSFPNILAPRETKDEETGKVTKRYELNMLFPPGFDKTDKPKLMKAFSEAMIEEHGKDRDKWPKLKRKPGDVIRDFAEFNENANKPLDGDWNGWTLARANATLKRPPNVVGPVRGANGKFPTITDEREVYGGRWAMATVEAYYYNHKQGGKGVTLGLCNVQLLKHDGKFGASVSAPESDFDDASEEWAGDTDNFDRGASGSDDEAQDDFGGGNSDDDDEIPF